MITAPLPTDNLYKFLALGGLIACGASYWVPNQMEASITPKIYESRIRLFEFEADLEKDFPLFKKSYEVLIPSDIDRSEMYPGVADPRLFYLFKTLLDTMMYLEENESTPEKLKIMIHNLYTKHDGKTPRKTEDETLKAMLEMAKLQAKDRYAFKMRILKLEQELSVFWDLCERRKEYKQMSKLGAIVGALFAVLGFVLWYFRVQVHQDRLLVAQAEEIKSKISQNPNTSQEGDTPTK